jgi:hypothetical protein
VTIVTDGTDKLTDRVCGETVSTIKVDGTLEVRDAGLGVTVLVPSVKTGSTGEMKK